MKKIIFIIILIFVASFLTACGNPQEIHLCSDGTVAGDQQITSSNFIYVCPDGKKTQDVSNCYFNSKSSIDEDSAKNKATNYVRGYVTANGWTTQFVNTYIEEGDWYAQLVIAKYEQESYQTTVKVDGEKGVVSCIKNCDYSQ